MAIGQVSGNQAGGVTAAAAQGAGGDLKSAIQTFANDLSSVKTEGLGQVFKDLTSIFKILGISIDFSSLEKQGGAATTRQNAFKGIDGGKTSDSSTRSSGSGHTAATLAALMAKYDVDGGSQSSDLHAKRPDGVLDGNEFRHFIESSDFGSLPDDLKTKCQYVFDNAGNSEFHTPLEWATKIMNAKPPQGWKSEKH